MVSINKINSKYLFLLGLLFFLAFFIYSNKNVNIGSLSSDVWLYQYISIQEKENQPWAYIPPLYNNEKFYLAYPIFYHLNPGLNYEMTNYFFLAIFIVIAIYAINGLVIKKIFNSWILATLAASLVLIPRYIYSTHIGMLNFRNFRGLSFAFPFYFLLSYYWLIYGIKNKYKNIILAVVAGILVYLYPPVGVIIVPMFILLSLIIHKKEYIKETFIFTAVYLIVSSLFWYGHFSNPNSGMTDTQAGLGPEELALQAEIMNYRFPDISFFGIDFGTLKRSIWDGLPLLLIFLSSLYLSKKYRKFLTKEQVLFSKINIYFTILLFLFVTVVEFINYYLRQKGMPPIFVEHWRLLRVIGFLWIAQACLFIYILYNKKGKKFLAIIISLILLLAPIHFSATFIRSATRAVVPESIRGRFNLAPIINDEENKDFSNLVDVANWTKYNLSKEDTKIFVFNYFQSEFKFKVLSQHDTNLTSKEGSIWATSGFENSIFWYQERLKYDEIVKDAENFEEVLNYIQNLGCTHILLPRGKYSDLYEASDVDNLSVLYSNYDYKILKID